MNIIKGVFKLFAIWILGVVLVVALCNLLILATTFLRVKNEVSNLENHKVALVLGTSKKTSSGLPNQYFTNRINAACELYRQGKVKHIILSGDNGSKFYNEPKDMLSALKSKGIPRHAITLDYAGFRTLDSVIRCKEVFGQQKIIIVTQKFHTFRALFIANFYDVDAKAFVAEDPAYNTAKVKIRELFARVKAILDLYFFDMRPKYLGKREIIDI